MGADVHDQGIKKRRDHLLAASLSCRPCNRKFASHHEARTHRAQHHTLRENSSSPAEPGSSSATGSRTASLQLQGPNPSIQADVHSGPKISSTPPPPPGAQNHNPAALSTRSPFLVHPVGSSVAAHRPTVQQGATARDIGTSDRHISVRDGTSSPSPIPSESLVSRTQTPQLPGNADGADHMHISRLSLDEDRSRIAVVRPTEIAVPNRMDTSSPSKKRPASTEAHDPRGMSTRMAHNSGARHRPAHGQHQPAPALAHGTAGQRSRLRGDRTREPNASERSMMDQKRSPQKPKDGADVFAKPHVYAFDTQADVSSFLNMQQQQQMAQSTQLKREATSNSISKEQLLVEVKGLYRSLEVVEKRCITLDQAHMSQQGKRAQPEPKHWQALTALHRTLLYEHHDFLLASQYPTAPAELKALASECQIPFRMWKYAIHAYLELLRQHLPESFEFMESFIYLSYQMMALLYETVPLFVDVWTECLGDLARYRMAIENHSASVREIWSEVAKWWYSRASDRQPLVGRLYHHLGILARPFPSRQLFYYCKALCCVQPFPNAKHSLKAAFDTSDNPQSNKPVDGVNAADYLFVRIHKLVFEATVLDEAKSISSEFLNQLDKSLPRGDNKWKEHGISLAITNLVSCFGYGSSEDALRRAVERKAQARTLTSAMRSETWQGIARKLLSTTLEVLLRRVDDKIVLPHVNVVMASLQILCPLANACIEAARLLQDMPWAAIVACMNTLSRDEDNLPQRVRNAKVEQRFFPIESQDVPLLEDFAMRGLVWCKDYFPEKWFDNFDRDTVPGQEPSGSDCSRSQRILWSAVKISMESSFLNFDRNSGLFEMGDYQIKTR